MTRRFPSSTRLASNQPLVSVVTPVLNRVTTVSQCLSSVAAQTYPSIEHIVIDGGSTDGTREVLEIHTSNRAFRWVSESDEGMYDAINKGLGMARGEILCYLNSDDLYFPWSVETAVERLRSGSALVYGDLAVLERHAERTSFYIQFYPEFDLRYFTHVATIGQPTVFWQRSLTDRIGVFDRQYRLIGDCEYWLRAGAAGATIQHIGEVLAIQVEHQGTLRATNPQRLREEFRQLRSQYSTQAGRPVSPRLERLKKSVFWRKRQLEFGIALRRRDSKEWPRFSCFLRKNGIGISYMAMLASMLPRAIRPPRPLWVNGIDAELQLVAAATGQALDATQESPPAPPGRSA